MISSRVRTREMALFRRRLMPDSKSSREKPGGHVPGLEISRRSEKSARKIEAPPTAWELEGLREPLEAAMRRASIWWDDLLATTTIATSEQKRRGPGPLEEPAPVDPKIGCPTRRSVGLGGRASHLGGLALCDSVPRRGAT